jgi:hypothetical protein
VLVHAPAFVRMEPGALGPGMTSPAWPPGEAGAPVADDIPF